LATSHLARSTRTRPAPLQSGAPGEVHRLLPAAISFRDRYAAGSDSRRTSDGGNTGVVATYRGAGKRPRGSFEGRVALVSGGGSGIGRAAAVTLAGLGAVVVVTGRRRDMLEQTAASASGIEVVPGDVSRVDDASRIVQFAAAVAGRLDVLVNNAGLVRQTPLGEITPKSAQELWATNVLGPMLLTQFALPDLEHTRGAIVNVSSTFGRKPAPGISVYGATKAALEHLTRSWALELAARGVRVNAVAPGPTQSEALERSGLAPDAVEAVKDAERREIPLGRRGDPDDVARWIVALSDPAAEWVTGQVMGVDGGYGLV
jgi:NAD(P)-dependent dehydrogenase (short-subunit alcohol dehydrogenase family)